MTHRVARLSDSVIEILELKTKLFRNCLRGMDDQTIRHRITGNTNNLHFRGCHLVEERYFASTLIGTDEPSPFPELASVRTIDEMPDPGPDLNDILENWNRISGLLPDRIRFLDDSVLLSRSDASFPTSSSSVLGGLTFLMQHESYHIGQMALLRKALGFTGMSYRWSILPNGAEDPTESASNPPAGFPRGRLTGALRATSDHHPDKSTLKQL